MSIHQPGRLLSGPQDVLRAAVDRFEHQPVDLDLMGQEQGVVYRRQKTLARSVSVTGPGTFLGKATRTLRLEPFDQEGWWFLRDDLADSLPVRVSVRNVWTTGDIVSNIVLRSGPPQNYIRMVEHIVALKLGLPIDNVLIRVESGDPPLFDRGSLDLIEALESAGELDTGLPVSYFTVKEPVTVCSPAGSFLTLYPCEGSEPKLTMDCAIDFPTAIGKQRIRFPLNPGLFKQGSVARTNTSFIKMLYCRTLGKLFADVRNLGYTMDNILVASRWGYLNEPRLKHNGKSLEAAWHRAVLDLLAALALVEEGRFAGHVISYRAGHALDCHMIRLLYKHQLLRRLPSP